MYTQMSFKLEQTEYCAYDTEGHTCSSLSGFVLFVWLYDCVQLHGLQKTLSPHTRTHARTRVRTRTHTHTHTHTHTWKANKTHHTIHTMWENSPQEKLKCFLYNKIQLSPYKMWCNDHQDFPCNNHTSFIAQYMKYFQGLMKGLWQIVDFVTVMMSI